MPKLTPLTLDALRNEAGAFADLESKVQEKSLFGVTDGKKIGTYVEHKFNRYLEGRYDFKTGNAASGIDFPALGVDVKVTSIRQPQSSCPYRNARQKIFGLGYSLLVFVYEKTDIKKTRSANLKILHAIFVSAERTADFQTTRGILEILQRKGNADDLVGFMQDRMLPVEEQEARQIAIEIAARPPTEGYLTISNALQWRLQYTRVIE